MVIDHQFFLAVGALGWGLSLISYRPVALAGGWPLGRVQAIAHDLAVALGGFSILVGLVYAAAQGFLSGGVVILLFGAALAVFWTGFLRVGAQSALLLAPIAALGLLLSWVLGALVG